MAHHKSLEQFAFECNITLQAVYLNEFGVYPSILPSILHRLKTYYEQDESELVRDYEKYVQTKRFNFGEEHKPYKLPESDLQKNPIASFRALLTCTRIGFAKSICVQPSLLYKVEEGKTDVIPGQLSIALREIQLPVGDIQELQDRLVEHNYARR
jgi:hypothetical protein